MVSGPPGSSLEEGTENDLPGVSFSGCYFMQCLRFKQFGHLFCVRSDGPILHRFWRASGTNLKGFGGH